MAFEILNEAASVVYVLAGENRYPQAEPDKVDFDILAQGINEEGVVSGCVVTPQGVPDATVAVAAGVVRIGGTDVAFAGGNVNCGAAAVGFPRFDLIAIDNAGVASAVNGIAAAVPVFPAVPANSVIVAAVWRAANDNTITAADIVDKRCLLLGDALGTVPTLIGIVGGIATPNRSHHTISAQAGAADDLDGLAVSSIITNGEIVVIRPDAGDVITVKHNALGGADARNILCIGNADIVCDDDHDFVICIYASAIGAGSWMALQGGTKYTDAEAIAAVEGEATLDLTGNVTIAGTTLLSGEVTLADGVSLNLQEAITFTGATLENLIEFPDNLADALSFEEGGNPYMTFDSRNGAERVVFETSVHFSPGDVDIRIEDITALATTDAGMVWTGTAISALEAGLFTEANGELLSFGINVPQVGARNNAFVGGIFRMDARGGPQEIVVIGYATGGAVAEDIFAADIQNGGFELYGPNTLVGPTLGIRQRTVAGHAFGFDIDLETVTTGRLDFYRVHAGARTHVYTIMRSRQGFGIGTTNPDADAILELASTTGALLLPRMTTAQRNAIGAANGMIIYNTTTNAFNFYENGAWVSGSGLA